ncbi:YccF domain-containing protein [Propionibacterium cyclohexanicum]|uniref:YccF domain-containing protein n=1 Tax=Propionibacterium cyclohexanicum TaxID=64702 RepID=UPI001FDF194A|nr:YccF domain-containing protein [Propionibacterium cyclohexanicum]
MPKPLSTILNVLWLLLGGIWLGLAYLLAGIVGCVLIITFPAGIASFRMARYVLWPFGKTVVQSPGAGAGSAVMNVIWFVTVGWLLALVHILTAITQSITIVGIANAVVSIKMIPVSVMPFGKRIVDVGGAQSQREEFGPWSR